MSTEAIVRYFGDDRQCKSCEELLSPFLHYCNNCHRAHSVEFVQPKPKPKCINVIVIGNTEGEISPKLPISWTKDDATDKMKSAVLMACELAELTCQIIKEINEAEATRIIEEVFDEPSPRAKESYIPRSWVNEVW